VSIPTDRPAVLAALNAQPHARHVPARGAAVRVQGADAQQTSTTCASRVLRDRAPVRCAAGAAVLRAVSAVFVPRHGLTEPVSAVLRAFAAVLRAGCAVLTFVGHAESIRTVGRAFTAVLGTAFTVLAGDTVCVPAFQRTEPAVLPAVLAVLVRYGTQSVAAVYRAGAAVHRAQAAVTGAVQAVLGVIAETVSAQAALTILADAVGIVRAGNVRDRLGTGRKRRAQRGQGSESNQGPWSKGCMTAGS
jgi:hypothetical protein